MAATNTEEASALALLRCENAPLFGFETTVLLYVGSSLDALLSGRVEPEMQQCIAQLLIASADLSSESLRPALYTTLRLQPFPVRWVVVSDLPRSKSLPLVWRVSTAFHEAPCASLPLR